MGVCAYGQQITVTELDTVLSYEHEEEVYRFLMEQRLDKPANFHRFGKTFMSTARIIDLAHPAAPLTISESGSPIKNWSIGYGLLRYLTTADILAAMPRLESLNVQEYWRLWCQEHGLDAAREPQEADFHPFTGDEMFESREALLAERKRRDYIEGYQITYGTLLDFAAALRSAADAGDVLLLWLG